MSCMEGIPFTLASKKLMLEFSLTVTVDITAISTSQTEGAFLCIHCSVHVRNTFCKACLRSLARLFITVIVTCVDNYICRRTIVYTYNNVGASLCDMSMFGSGMTLPACHLKIEADCKDCFFSLSFSNYFFVA